MLSCSGSANKYSRLDAKLEKRMAEFKRASGQSNFRSIDGIILRFPQFREEQKNIRNVFDLYDEDSNGTVDLEELKKWLQKLQLHLTAEEIEIFFIHATWMGVKGYNSVNSLSAGIDLVMILCYHKEMDWDKNGKVKEIDASIGLELKQMKKYLKNKVKANSIRALNLVA